MAIVGSVLSILLLCEALTSDIVSKARMAEEAMWSLLEELALLSLGMAMENTSMPIEDRTHCCSL